MDIVKRLKDYKQADEEGVMVLASRQAIDGAAAEIERLRAALKDMLELVEPLSFEGESLAGFKRIMDRIIHARAALPGKKTEDDRNRADQA